MGAVVAVVVVILWLVGPLVLAAALQRVVTGVADRRAYLACTVVLWAVVAVWVLGGSLLIAALAWLAFSEYGVEGQRVDPQPVVGFLLAEAAAGYALAGAVVGWASVRRSRRRRAERHPDPAVDRPPVAASGPGGVPPGP